MGDRLTSLCINACIVVNVRDSLIKPSLLERIQEEGRKLGAIDDYDKIRTIYQLLEGEGYLKSHLAVVFQEAMSQISKIINEPLRGSRKRGRPKILTDDEEKAVLEFVRSAQLRGKCVTYAQTTKWINEELLDGQQRKVSRKFLYKNTTVTETLDTARPQLVEELRIDACEYTNIQPFFDRLKGYYDSYDYDPDLIINVDETTTNAEKSKKTTIVLFDPSLEMRPTCAIEPKVEHITLCCGVSASGKALKPVFIIKNKNVTTEDTLTGPLFSYGEYGLASSYNGWQDKVT